MERAQRQAEGPRKRILEAAARARQAEPVVIRAASRGARPPPAAEPVRGDGVRATVSPNTAESPPESAAPATTDATLLPTLPVVEPAPVTAIPTAAVPITGGEPAPALPSVAAAPVSAAPAPVLATTALAPPRLLQSVPPELPLRQLGRRAQLAHEVSVALTVLPDGRVGRIDLRRVSAPEIAESVIDALRQWRYEPGAAAREIEFLLVIKPESGS